MISNITHVNTSYLYTSLLRDIYITEVKVALEQATIIQRGSRGIDLLFL